MRLENVAWQPNKFCMFSLVQNLRANRKSRLGEGFSIAGLAIAVAIRSLDLLNQSLDRSYITLMGSLLHSLSTCLIVVPYCRIKQI